MNMPHLLKKHWKWVLLCLLMTAPAAILIAQSGSAPGGSERYQLAGIWFNAAGVIFFSLSQIISSEAVDRNTRQEKKQNLIRMLDEWHATSMGNARQVWFSTIDKLQWNEVDPLNGSRRVVLQVKDLLDEVDAKPDCLTEPVLERKEYQSNYLARKKLGLSIAFDPDNPSNKPTVKAANVLFDFFDKWAGIYESGSLDDASLHRAFEEYAIWYQANFLDVVEDMGALQKRHLQINKIKRIVRFLRVIQDRKHHIMH